MNDEFYYNGREKGVVRSRREKQWQRAAETDNTEGKGDTWNELNFYDTSTAHAPVPQLLNLRRVRTVHFRFANNGWMCVLERPQWIQRLPEVCHSL